jgi:hypothetical protein
MLTLAGFFLLLLLHSGHSLWGGATHV